MTDKERLIERLIAAASFPYSMDSRSEIELLADYLIENRVYIAPCDVGDTVYFLNLKNFTIRELKVNEILITRSRAMLLTLSDGYLHGASDYGISLFKTRIEAEIALAERRAKK